jgi:transcriptional regulator with XRE-family HTH domain
MVVFAHHGQRYDYRVLAAWHQKSGLRAEQVCVDAGVSYSYLGHLLAGRATRPTIGLLERLAAVYGRDIAELFTDAPAGAR